MEIPNAQSRVCFGNESGAALIQVLMIGALVGLTMYALSDFMVSQGKKSLRVVQRTDNIVTSSIFAANVNNSNIIHSSAASVLRENSSGTPITYP